MISAYKVLELANLNNQNIKINNDFSKFKEVVATVSGAKAYFTDITLNGLEVCRASCGGHGFS
jgi:hypothetical protein